LADIRSSVAFWVACSCLGWFLAAGFLLCALVEGVLLVKLYG
jgi:hypothetical protein